MHLCEWFTLSQVSSRGNNGKDKTRKKMNNKEKKIMIIIIIIKKKSQKGQRSGGTEGRERIEREKKDFFFSFLRFSLRSTKIGS